jgi:hypothetical protein
MDEPMDDDLLGTVLAGAYAATQHGDTARAKVLIAGTLSQLDRHNATADPAVIELAVLWACLATDSADPPRSVLGWAEWAVIAAERVYGPGHRQTGRALLALAGVHSARGEHLAAAAQYQALAEPCFARRNLGAALLARECLGVELHAGGRCQAGITELTVLVHDQQAWLIRRPADHRHQLAAMLAACGRVAEARAWLADADPSTAAAREVLSTIIATAPVADIDPMHALVCERQPPNRTGPTTGRSGRRTGRADPGKLGDRRPFAFDDLWNATHRIRPQH